MTVLEKKRIRLKNLIKFLNLLKFNFINLKLVKKL